MPGTTFDRVVCALNELRDDPVTMPVASTPVKDFAGSEGDWFESVMELEDEFDIEIRDAESAPLHEKSIGDVVALVEQKLAAQSAAPEKPAPLGDDEVKIGEECEDLE